MLLKFLLSLSVKWASTRFHAVCRDDDKPEEGVCVFPATFTQTAFWNYCVKNRKSSPSNFIYIHFKGQHLDLVFSGKRWVSPVLLKRRAETPQRTNAAAGDVWRLLLKDAEWIKTFRVRWVMLWAPSWYRLKYIHTHTLRKPPTVH